MPGHTGRGARGRIVSEHVVAIRVGHRRLRRRSKKLCGEHQQQKNSKGRTFFSSHTPNHEDTRSAQLFVGSAALAPSCISPRSSRILKTHQATTPVVTGFQSTTPEDRRSMRVSGVCIDMSRSVQGRRPEPTAPLTRKQRAEFSLAYPPLQSTNAFTEKHDSKTLLFHPANTLTAMTPAALLSRSSFVQNSLQPCCRATARCKASGVFSPC